MCWVGHLFLSLNRPSVCTFATPFHQSSPHVGLWKVLYLFEVLQGARLGTFVNGQSLCRQPSPHEEAEMGGMGILGGWGV